MALAFSWRCSWSFFSICSIGNWGTSYGAEISFGSTPAMSSCERLSAPPLSPATPAPPLAPTAPEALSCPGCCCCCCT
uniref:Putative secreted protein n=1 Tax=Anopheles darlingi TaxID=43151 RepID=A0A2M4D6G3_ANODA